MSVAIPENSVMIGEKVGSLAVDGLYVVSEPSHVDVMNSRIEPRWYPDAPLDAWFTPVGCSTRQTHFLKSDSSARFDAGRGGDTESGRATTPYGLGISAIGMGKVYSPYETFTPPIGPKAGPWSGFAVNVNLESELRHQYNALQKSDQSVYVPSSQSQLYRGMDAVGYDGGNQPHPLLFSRMNEVATLREVPGGNQRIGNMFFQNSTRTQLKNL